MKGLVIALQFLTRLPTPRITVSDKEFAASIRWFPAAGLVIGVIVALAGWAMAPLDPWAGALAALLAWIMVTGALHLDGLGDIADAAGAAHKDRERLLAVLADPHLGSFGAVAIGLQITAKLVLLHAVIANGLFAGVVALPFAARIGPLLWTSLLPPLHPGLGARFANSTRTRDIAGWLALLAGAAAFVPALLAALPLMLLWSAWLRRKLGGISGDGHGAGIELVETGLLLILVIADKIA